MAGSEAELCEGTEKDLDFLYPGTVGWKVVFCSSDDHPLFLSILGSHIIFDFVYSISFVESWKCLFPFVNVTFIFLPRKPDPKTKPDTGSPRALAQKVSGDRLNSGNEDEVDDDMEDHDLGEDGICEIRTCQRLIDDLAEKMFNIERNLLQQIDILREKLEGTRTTFETRPCNLLTLLKSSVKGGLISCSVWSDYWLDYWTTNFAKSGRTDLF